MNATPKFLSATATVDERTILPLPNSRKIYIEGSRPDIQVAMREISQSDTAAPYDAEKNPSIYVYDCSGPYTDLHVSIDISNQGVKSQYCSVRCFYVRMRTLSFWSKSWREPKRCWELVHV